MPGAVFIGGEFPCNFRADQWPIPLSLAAIYEVAGYERIGQLSDGTALYLCFEEDASPSPRRASDVDS